MERAHRALMEIDHDRSSTDHFASSNYWTKDRSYPCLSPEVFARIAESVLELFQTLDSTANLINYLVSVEITPVIPWHGKRPENTFLEVEMMVRGIDLIVRKDPIRFTTGITGEEITKKFFDEFSKIVKLQERNFQSYAERLHNLKGFLQEAQTIDA